MSLLSLRRSGPSGGPAEPLGDREGGRIEGQAAGIGGGDGGVAGYDRVAPDYRNELDKMMTKFKASAPDFYSAYLAARVIVDRPGTRKKKDRLPPAP
jgi:hypothetical protein